MPARREPCVDFARMVARSILWLALIAGTLGCGPRFQPSDEDTRVLRKLAYLRGAVILMRDAGQEARVYREIANWDTPMAGQVLLQDRVTREVFAAIPRPSSPGPFKVLLLLVRVDEATGEPRFGCAMAFPPIALDNLDLLVEPHGP